MALGLERGSVEDELAIQHDLEVADLGWTGLSGRRRGTAVLEHQRVAQVARARGRKERRGDAAAVVSDPHPAAVLDATSHGGRVGACVPAALHLGGLLERERVDGSGGVEDPGLVAHRLRIGRACGGGPGNRSRRRDHRERAEQLLAEHENVLRSGR